MVMAKTAPMNKAQAQAWIKNFLQHFQNLFNQKNMPTVADLEKIVTPNFHFTSNEEIMTRSAADYLNRLIKLRKKYSHFELKGPLEEPVANENRLAFNYILNLRSPNGQNVEVIIMTIVTLEDNKIAKWSQLTHEKHPNQWDA